MAKSNVLKPGSAAGALVAALLVYGAFAAVLYAPIQRYLGLPEVLVPVSSILAAAGACLLARRWIPTFDAAILAGLLYGFGPFLLSMNTTAHPVAGLGVALVPWLFCPAALWHKYEATTLAGTLLRTLLLAAPFAVLFLWFWLPAQPFIGPFFLTPKGASVSLGGLYALTGEYALNGIVTGFISSGLILSLLGTLVFVRTAKIAVFLPVFAGIILLVWDPVGDVNPAVWFALPALFLAVTAGVGASTAALFGPQDRKWIIAGIILSAVLLVMGLTRMFSVIFIFTLPAVFFGLTAVLLTLFLFMNELPFRPVLLRRLLLAALVALNLYLAARSLLT